MMAVKNLALFGLVGALWVAGSAKSTEQRKAVIAKFHLGAEQTKLMDACKSSLSRNNKEFKQGAPTLAGCACVAAKAGESESKEDYPLIEAAMDIAISGDVSSRLEGVAKKFDGQEFKVIEKLSFVADAISYCGQAANHATPQQKAELDKAKRR